MNEIKNAHVPIVDHVLHPNQGTQALLTCRGSHLCAWLGGPSFIVAMVSMIVAANDFVEIPSSTGNGC